MPSQDVSAQGRDEDPIRMLQDVPLSDAELAYVDAARAENTLLGYRSDWREFSSWCAMNQRIPMPADAVTISRYLTDLAGHGARVGTMSRRLSALRFAHQLRGHPDPTRHARVVAVWEGIRRTHGAPPDQAAPLMPPELFDVLAACPTQKVFKDPRRPAEADLAGLRDRALLLVGFVAALRRSEIAAMDVADLAEHPNGQLITIPRSKTNQTGEQSELVVLPRGTNTLRCPVAALTSWLTTAGITDGPVFRPVSKGNRALARPLHPESINTLVKQAIARAGIDPTNYSAHSLRAGFVTYAHSRGANDHAIAHQTRHKSLATLTTYIRTQTVWDDNAATSLGL
jgi:site-specific recombinase XerD